jgi:hypothetical protein
VSGITGNVDMNQFNGTLADLQAFAGGATTQRSCSELGGASLQCAERADCESIINDQGAQVCVPRP